MLQQGLVGNDGSSIFTPAVRLDHCVAHSLPAFTVGLASYIAVLEGLHFATGRQIYFRISGFWIKIFAISFGMGVVSGIIMPFQFGTNWSRFPDITANVLSPLLAYKGLTAFFLESAFLGVLLFSRTLVPRWAHFFAAHGGGWNAFLFVLDFGNQQLDADAGRAQEGDLQQWARRHGQWALVGIAVAHNASCEPRQLPLQPNSIGECQR